MKSRWRYIPYNEMIIKVQFSRIKTETGYSDKSGQVTFVHWAGYGYYLFAMDYQI